MPPAARIDIAPHSALTPRSAARFFAGICFVSFAIALSFAALGYWPVLPFAGLEMALLGWALRASLARSRHGETIVVTEGSVAIESHSADARGAVVFPRHWAQVKLRAGVSPLHPSRLSIESHGRRCEIGSFLTEQERQGLARRLRTLIGGVSESPPLRVEGPARNTVSQG
jgi:uncharacterized membrane protein